MQTMQRASLSGDEIRVAADAGGVGCGRRIGPFNCCTCVCIDCLEAMRALPDGCVDAVITDPPYGMGWKFTGQGSGANAQGAKVSQFSGITIHGDAEEFNPEHLLRFPKIILWGFHHFPQKLERGTVLVWVKKYPDAFGTFLSDADLAWMRGGCGVYLSQTINPASFQDERRHPTQKPIQLMEWCIEKAGMPETILDPYCGSGTTLIAAKKLGRHFLGFEISEEYCQIARERIARIEAQPTLFEPKSEQIKLL